MYLNQHSFDVIERAKEIWPESEGNLSEIVRKILADWDRIREKGGGRMQQVNARLDRHEMYLILICRRMGIEFFQEEETHVQ